MLGETMECDQEHNSSGSLLYESGGAFFAEDSSLLSNYLHHQAKIAGNRVLHHRKSVTLLPSELLFAAPLLEQAQEGESSCPYFPIGSSSVNSIAAGSFITQKETSESFVGRECSSQFLSPVLSDEKEPNSAPIYRTLPSSFSSIECSNILECSPEATTGIAIADNGLDLQRSCGNSRKVDCLADAEMFFEGDHTVVLKNATGFDLLIYAAMQVEFFGKDNHDSHGTSFDIHEKSGNGDGSPQDRSEEVSVQDNSFVLRRRVIRRARSAFPKRSGSNSLKRLGIVNPVVGSREDIQSVREKNDDSETNLAVTSGQMQQGSITRHYMRRKPHVLPLKSDNDALERISMENQDEKIPCKHIGVKTHVVGHGGVHIGFKAHGGVHVGVKADDMGHGSPITKLKILPIKSCSRTSKEKPSNPVVDGETIRKRKGQHAGCNPIDRPSAEAKDSDLLTRSKRGRSRVLPMRFADSVLPSWNITARKGKS